MDNLEFRILTMGLFLETRHIAKIGGYENLRTIRRFKSGDLKIHDDLIDKLILLDKKIDDSVTSSVCLALEKKVDTVEVKGFSEAQYYELDEKNKYQFYELYLCQIFRLKKALEKIEMNLITT